MRLRWFAIPAVILLHGCSDPAAAYREAAKQLKFTLERVEPSAHVTLPLEQSKLTLRVTLMVENPTKMRFQTRSINGFISLESDGASYDIGELNFVEGMDLKPGTRTPVQVDLTFSYRDLQKSWVPLRMVGSGSRPGTWHVDGKMGLDILGVRFTVPLKVQKHMGGQ